jgi:hypothetical protein
MFGLWQPRYAAAGIATFPVILGRQMNAGVKEANAAAEQLVLLFPNPVAAHTEL